MFEFVEGAMLLTLQLSMPPVLVAAGVGILVGLIQALTQIQDQSLPQAVKLIAVAIVIIVVGVALSQRLAAYATSIFNQIAAGV